MTPLEELEQYNARLGGTNTITKEDRIKVHTVMLRREYITWDYPENDKEYQEDQKLIDYWTKKLGKRKFNEMFNPKTKIDHKLKSQWVIGMGRVLN